LKVLSWRQPSYGTDLLDLFRFLEFESGTWEKARCQFRLWILRRFVVFNGGTDICKEPMLLILNDLRQLREILQFHLLLGILFFVCLELVEHEILNNVNLTLDGSLFVIHHVLIFLLVLLVAESDHRTKEDCKRLLRNIFFFEVIPEDFGATLSHLVFVFGIVDFKNFKALACL
jgi:hypothetical protein